METIQDIECNDLRFEKLHHVIEEYYGDLKSEDFDQISIDFEEIKTSMVDIIDVGSEEVCLYDSDRSVFMSEVLFPSEILKLLKPDDAFLATIGLSEGKWHILWLSPPYETIEWNVEDLN